jgi:hypothetical protein
VPTQPVFTPRSCAVAVFPSESPAEEVPRGPATSSPSGKLDSGGPERGTVPIPAPPLTKAKVPSDAVAPQRLDPAADDASSWVFDPPLPAAMLRNTDPTAEWKVDSAGKGAGQQAAKP